MTNRTDLNECSAQIKLLKQLITQPETFDLDKVLIELETKKKLLMTFKPRDYADIQKGLESGLLIHPNIEAKRLLEAKRLKAIEDVNYAPLNKMRRLLEDTEKAKTEKLRLAAEKKAKKEAERVKKEAEVKPSKYPNPKDCLVCRGEVPSNEEEYKDALLYHKLRCEKEPSRVEEELEKLNLAKKEAEVKALAEKELQDAKDKLAELEELEREEVITEEKGE